MLVAIARVRPGSRCAGIRWALALSRFGLAAALLATVAACAERTPTNEGNGPAYGAPLGVSAALVNVDQGAAAAVTVRLVGCNDGGGRLTLVALNLPADITVRFGLPSVASGDTLSQVTISAASSAAIARHTIRIQANGNGVARFVDVVVNVRRPDLRVAVGSQTASASVAPLQSVIVPISVTRAPGFNDDVTLSLSGVPAAVTARWSPSTITAAASTSALVLTASIDAPIATYTLTVHATSVSGTVASTPLTLVITPSTVPQATLAVGPTSLSANVDSTVRGTIALQRTGGFTGSVALSVENAPAGVRVTWEPAVVTGNSSGVLLRPSSSTPPGNYTLIVRGTATGAEVIPASVTLRVLPPPGVAISAPPALTLSIGGGVIHHIGVTRAGAYRYPVEFSIDPLPVGVTATVLTNQASELQVYIAVGADAKLGTYPMVIRVRGAGNIEATTPLTVTVTPIEGSYTLSVTPSPLTVVQGTSVSARVRTERMGGFTNSVSVVVDFAPAGMSV